MHAAKKGKSCLADVKILSFALDQGRGPDKVQLRDTHEAARPGPVWAPLCRSREKTAHPAPVGHSPGPARDWAAVVGASNSGCNRGHSQPGRVTGKSRPLRVGGELSSGLRASPRENFCCGHLDTSTSIIPTRCECVQKGGRRATKCRRA